MANIKVLTGSAKAVFRTPKMIVEPHKSALNADEQATEPSAQKICEDKCLNDMSTYMLTCTFK